MENNEPIIGTNFELFLEGDLVQGMTEFKSTYQLDEKEWRACGDADKHTLVTGKKGTGNLVTNKINSKFNKILINAWNKLKNPSFYGAGVLKNAEGKIERVEYFGIKFNQLDIQNVKVDDLGNMQLPFTFERCEITDAIE